MSKHTGCYKSRMKFLTNIWCGYLSRHVTQIFKEKYIGLYCFVNFLGKILNKLGMSSAKLRLSCACLLGWIKLC